MSRLLAALLLAPAIAWGQSCTTIDEESNFGGMTVFNGYVNPFCYIDTWGVPANETLTGIRVHGTHGQVFRGFYETSIDEPTGIDGVAWTCTHSDAYGCYDWAGAVTIPGPTSALLQLQVSGHSCGGFLCGIEGDGYIYVHPSYFYTPPPPTCGTPTTPPCDDSGASK